MERLQALKNDQMLRACVRSIRSALHFLAPYFGYQLEGWSRAAQRKIWIEFFETLNHERMDCAEISPESVSWIKEIGWGTYTPLQYPDFDICEGPTDKQFDIVIANQVWEHLQFPYKAGTNAYAMLKDGGWFAVATPFLLRIHPMPGDYTRWTPAGLRQFLIEVGFDDAKISVDSWGNRQVAKASLKAGHWPKIGWRRAMNNEWDVPVTVWAFAQK